MGAQLLLILLVIAVAYTMLAAGVAKKHIQLVCRRCHRPLERCRCPRVGRRRTDTN